MKDELSQSSRRQKGADIFLLEELRQRSCPPETSFILSGDFEVVTAYLEDGKKNDMLHPDPNIDDAVQFAQTVTKVPLSWKRES